MAEAFGLEMNDLPDDCIPLGAICIVKVLRGGDDGDGEIAWSLRHSMDLNIMERLGMLKSALSITDNDIQEMYAPRNTDGEG